MYVRTCIHVPGPHIACTRTYRSICMTRCTSVCTRQPLVLRIKMPGARSAQLARYTFMSKYTVLETARMHVYMGTGHPWQACSPPSLPLFLSLSRCGHASVCIGPPSSIACARAGRSGPPYVEWCQWCSTPMCGRLRRERLFPHCHWHGFRKFVQMDRWAAGNRVFQSIGRRENLGFG